LGGSEFHDFILRLRRVFGRVSFVAVPEFQDKKKRGALHYHTLVWGLPQSLGDIRYKKKILSYGLERTFRLIGGIWGRGFADVIQTDGSSKLSYYLSKYFSKAWLDKRFDGHRVVFYSNGFPIPLTVHDYGDDSILSLPLSEICSSLDLVEVDNYSYQSSFFGKVEVNRFTNSHGN